MKKLLIAVLLLSALIYGLLFSSAGSNHLLRPLLNRMIQKKLPAHRIVIRSLELGPSSLSMTGVIDGGIRIGAHGPMHWLSRRFDLSYTVDADRFEAGGKHLPAALHLRGTLEGTPDRMKVRGEGRAFDAKVRYRFMLRQGNPEDIVALVRGARIDQILAMTGRPVYARGLADLSIDLPRFAGQASDGNATLHVRNGVLLAKTLRKSAGVDLVEDTPFVLDFRARARGRLLRGEGVFRSAPAELTVSSMLGDRFFRVFKGRYRLKLPDLGKLSSLTGRNLRGALDTRGVFYYDRRSRKAQLLGESASLGGKLRYRYDSGGLTLNLHKLSIPRMLSMLDQPPLARSGTLGGKIRFDSLKELRGAFDLAVSGVLSAKELRRKYRMRIAEDLPLSLRGKGTLKRGSLEGRLHLRSLLAEVELNELKLSTSGGNLRSAYVVKVPRLQRLSPWTGRKLYGSLQTRGRVAFAPSTGTVDLRGDTRSLGGIAEYGLQGDRFTLTLKKIRLPRVLALLGQPPVLSDGRADGTLELSSLRRLDGLLHIGLSGRIDRRTMLKAYGLDPGEKMDFSLKSQGALVGGIFKGKAALRSSMGDLDLKPLRYDLRRSKLSSSYRLAIPDLGRLRPLTGRRYKGAMNIVGIVRKDRQLHITGKGREFGGTVLFDLLGSRLVIDATGVTVSKVMEMLDYPRILEASSRAHFVYDLNKRSGSVRATLDGAHLMPSNFTAVVRGILGYDLTREIFTRSLFTARIDPATTVFDLNASNPRLALEVRNGRIDRRRQKIDAVAMIEWKGKRYKVRLSGPVSRPRIQPMLGEMIRENAKERIKKAIDKKLPKGSGGLKGLIENIF